MEPEKQINRLVSYLERELITSNEFFNSMLEALGELPTGEKQTIFGALAGHSCERVREAVVEVQAFARNQEVSRDFEHVRRNSPLRPGIRLELFDKYSEKQPAAWLGGRDCYRATFVRFERWGNRVPVALIEFDEAIDMPGHKGRYGVLITRYGVEYAAWERPEGEVALYVVEALPNDIEEFWEPHTLETALKRYAGYRVKETPVAESRDAERGAAPDQRGT